MCREKVLLIGNWYRPGATVHDGHAALQAEVAKLAEYVTGMILAGDCNIHLARWLRYSNDNSTQGADLKIVCDNLGLQQLVRELTRQQYLLDLFLTNVAGTKVGVGVLYCRPRFLAATIPLPEITSLHQL